MIRLLLSPAWLLVTYDFGHMGNLVLTFEGGLFSKVLGSHLTDSGILGRKILVTFHFDLPVSSHAKRGFPCLLVHESYRPGYNNHTVALWAHTVQT